MQLEKFWHLIDVAIASEDKEFCLRNALNNLSKTELGEFIELQGTLETKANRWDIWGAAYLIYGDCSDDEFMDFKRELLFLGRNIYEEVIDSPDKLVNFDLKEDIRELGLGYVAQDLYEEKFLEPPSIDESVVCSEMGLRWDFDDYDECLKRLPNLTRHHWK
ncbi:DUF4240 domain-containing protein [Rheinheimera baltica]|uniref:DUF4240 domain-containing protein n=1 Tax=Rheinheimera baltica TaxID=67576 RepID=A0ABT9I4E7_9GAMM|nr:DUF4240 domain-containing protein [Rheinheimera baltica]MDP5138254.1 DUF4240 domain-containing protein [Rheinheimera baltica]MDP5148609.1 DUF4240 domain-containing protein [Rheinheimera baltica]